jgi:hypothetical protein
MSKLEDIAAELVNPIPEDGRKIQLSQSPTAFEQYKLFVEMTDKLAERRQTSNTFFLTIASALLGLVGLGSEAGTNGLTPSFLWLIPTVGVVTSYTWFRFIKSYRDLADARFKVLHEMEHNLPFRPYHAEWEALGRGNSPRSYVPFTRLEGVVPLVFLGVNIAALALTMPWPHIAALIRGS